MIGWHEGQHARVVPDDLSAWTAGQHNRYSLQVELVQPTRDHEYSTWQYEELARLIAWWREQHSIELVTGHEDTEHGRQNGKSDPGPMFDWDRLMEPLPL